MTEKLTEESTVSTVRSKEPRPKESRAPRPKDSRAVRPKKMRMGPETTETVKPSTSEALGALGDRKPVKVFPSLDEPEAEVQLQH